MREDWAEVPLDFEWAPELVADVDRLHSAGDDHAFADPSAHLAAFGLDVLRRAEDAGADSADVSLVAEVLGRWFSDATPELVADVRRRWRTEGERLGLDDSTEGYALFGLRLLDRYRTRA